MSPSQIRAVNSAYVDDFADDMSDATRALLRDVASLADLESIRDEISAGEFDNAEYILRAAS